MLTIKGCAPEWGLKQTKNNLTTLVIGLAQAPALQVHGNALRSE